MGLLGCILAGGQSSRMGTDKALVDLAGQPMIARAAARLAPQVDRLVVSANGDPGRFGFLPCPILPDGPNPSMGPLSGLAAVLAYAERHGFAAVVTAPCDAPFLPLDLAALLREAGDFALASSRSGPAPLFGLWPVRLRTAVEAALAELDHSVWRLARRCGAIFVLIEAGPDGIDPLANVNTPADVERVARLLVTRKA